jgi:signal transduction histidine kinase
LVRSGILPSNPITEKSYHIGLIWLVLMWSLALANRINLLKKETEEANLKLVQSERKLSQTLEGLPLGVVVYGSERVPTYINQRAANILSNPAKGIVSSVAAGRTLSEAIRYFKFRLSGSDETYPQERLPVAQAFEGRSASADDIEADLVDRRVPLEIWANPIKDEHGKVESVVAAFQDITERWQVQAELDAYRRQLEQMVSQRTSELSAVNEQLHLEINERQRLEEVLHLRLEWLVAVNQVNQSITKTSELPEAYHKFDEIIIHLFDANDAFLAEVDTKKKEMKISAHTCRNTAHPDLAGMVIHLQNKLPAEWLSERGKPIPFTPAQFKDLGGALATHYQHTKSQFFITVPQQFGDGLIGLLGLEFLESERLFSDSEIALLERICLDIDQVREKARISEQSQDLIAVEERSRLARDLHDSVTQVLFAASLVAEVLPQIWHRDPERAEASLEELRRLSRGALAEMRTMLLELRPAALINTPLSDLLTQLTEAVASRMGLEFQLFVEQTPLLPEDVHIGFYRIAQESLNNVVKHAHASLVNVSLSTNPQVADLNNPWHGEIKLMVQDNGRGFSEQEIGPQQLGLAIMHERAEAIQATLSVGSEPGLGTTVTLTWHT